MTRPRAKKARPPLMTFATSILTDSERTDGWYRCETPRCPIAIAAGFSPLAPHIHKHRSNP